MNSALQRFKLALISCNQTAVQFIDEHMNINLKLFEQSKEFSINIKYFNKINNSSYTLPNISDDMTPNKMKDRFVSQLPHLN